MRRLRSWAATFCALMLIAACADAPTAPQLTGGEAMAGAMSSYDSQTVQGCVIEGTCYLPPISGGGSTCDPYLELDWNCDEGGGDCMTSLPGSETDAAYVGLAGCYPEPTKPGGGLEPPPTAPGDTCKTGDTIIDDPEVSRELRSLWTQSNPDANLYQRVEKAGWIVEYPAGQFSIMQWTGGSERFGCGDYPAQAGPANGRIVGFVHTHPYEVDEAIVDCNLRSVQRYEGAPSDVDRRASVQLGQALGLGGPLPGYIIDKDGYYRFDGQSNTATPRRQRCGY